MIEVIAGPDTIPPSVPGNISVVTISTSTNISTVVAVWNNSTDNVLVSGYSFVWSENILETPDAIIETNATGTQTILTDGTWYFTVLAKDLSNNLSSVATFGPFNLSTTLDVDIVPPVGPVTVISSSHVVDATSTIKAVDLTWDIATDETSLSGYSYFFDADPTTSPDASVESNITNLQAILPNGIWYFHILSVDAAGNVSSSTTHFGPIIIDAPLTGDTTPPTGPVVVTSNTHIEGSTSTLHTVTLEWDDAIDETLLAGYSYKVSTSSNDTVSGIVYTTGTSTTQVLPNGVWYFYIASVDTNENISSVVTFGPIIIDDIPTPLDVIPPSDPVLTFVKTSSSTVLASWTSSIDDTALFGYSVLYTNSSSSVPDMIVEISSTSSETNLEDGVWYFSLRAIDTSLNSSAVITSLPLTVDTTAPIITLLGRPTMSVATGTVFTDPGYTALDTIDGDITGSVLVSGTVDTSVVGTYVLTYSVTDANGNASAQSTRTVHVLSAPDTDAPVIALNGNPASTLFVGDTYTELGATALDAVEGDLTPYISITGIVNTAATGTYEIIYSVADASSNLATATRTVSVIPIVYHDVYATKTGQGAITPAGTSTVVEGDSITYTITPNFGYELTDLLVDGVSVATTTSYTFTNIVSDHTIEAVFTALSGRPSFTIVTTASTSGMVSPQGTSTVLQGEDISITITPDVGYYIDTLTIDGVSIASTTLYTFTNVNADHDLYVTFAAYPPDVTPPSSVTVSSPTHSPGAPVSNQSVTLNWTASTDFESGLLGYSYVIDGATTTLPDATVETSSTTITEVLPNGTYYFHIIAVDNVGNFSSAYHYGPIVITDSAITITNSTFNGVTYVSYAPTVASGTELFITGTTTIINSTFSSPYSINSSNLSNVTASSTDFTRVVAVDSIFINSAFTDCTITNSFTKNYTGTNCTVSDSFIDPVGQTNDVTGSTITMFSQLFASDVLYSTVSASYIATSTVTYSTITTSTTTLSTVASSTFSGATVASSSVTSSTLQGAVVDNSSVSNSVVRDTTVSTSTLINVTTSIGSNAVITGSVLNGTVIQGTSTVITNSNIGNTTITDAVITDNVIYGGTVLLPSGSSTVVIVPTPVEVMINLPPSVTFTTSTNQGTVTIVDTSTDKNATSSPYLTDSWTYTINYGDGISQTFPLTSLGTTLSHTYGSSGTYIVTVTITDAYGGTTTSTSVVTVTVPVTGGGGGSSYGGGGGYYAPVPVATSSPSAPYLTSSNCLLVTSSSLYFGKRSDAVRELQRFLNGKGFTVAQSGSGSLGNETTYFGALTHRALIAYQRSLGFVPNGIYDGATHQISRCVGQVSSQQNVNEPTAVEPSVYIPTTYVVTKKAQVEANEGFIETSTTSQKEVKDSPFKKFFKKIKSLFE